jgi:uncharacterized protein YeaO (DUF488 family)
MLQLKRAYEPASNRDGWRVLVDQLWPRGVTKEALHLHSWNREVAPSRKLRQWFGHDPERWEGFRARYFEELEAHPETWKPLVDAARKGKVTLLYGARDEAHNNAVALREFLQKHGAARAPARHG